MIIDRDKNWYDIDKSGFLLLGNLDNHRLCINNRQHFSSFPPSFFKVNKIYTNEYFLLLRISSFTTFERNSFSILSNPNREMFLELSRWKKYYCE